MTGRFATRTSGLGRVWVSGHSRDPCPPAITIAFRILTFSHVKRPGWQETDSRWLTPESLPGSDSILPFPSGAPLPSAGHYSEAAGSRSHIAATANPAAVAAQAPAKTAQTPAESPN